jgi:hypothetical protein
MEISLTVSGSFDKTTKYLKDMAELPTTILKVADTEAQKGVAALRAATPKDSGLAASSWGYKVVQNGRRGVTITWTNTDLENGGFPVAIMLQYGYGTGSGGYVQGRDYINPAMKPVFESIAENVWKAVKSKR